MKGIVIAPKFYENNAWKSKALYDKLCEKYNFSYLCTDTPNLDGYDVAIIQSVPYHNRPAIPPGLLDAKCKLIGEFGDLQCWGDAECEKNKKTLFNRYDCIVGGYYHQFREWYPEHVHKYFYWPSYFGPYERYISLPEVSNPKMRCIMIGSHNASYFRRQYVINNRNRYPDNGRIDISGAWKIPFDKYPKYLSNYFCSLALPGKFNLPVAKYFEIPAAGVLLLATQVKELALCGMDSLVHYVPVTRANVFDKVKEVLDVPDKFVEIRDRGTKLVLETIYIGC
jgi:hypothetical protein